MRTSRSRRWPAGNGRRTSSPDTPLHTISSGWGHRREANEAWMSRGQTLVNPNQPISQRTNPHTRKRIRKSATIVERDFALQVLPSSSREGPVRMLTSINADTGPRPKPQCHCVRILGDQTGDIPVAAPVPYPIDCASPQHADAPARPPAPISTSNGKRRTEAQNERPTSRKRMVEGKLRQHIIV